MEKIFSEEGEGALAIRARPWSSPSRERFGPVADRVSENEIVFVKLHPLFQTVAVYNGTTGLATTAISASVLSREIPIQVINPKKFFYN